MAAPVVTILDRFDNVLDEGNPNNLGAVNAGSSSSEKTLKIVNNHNGTGDLSTMEGVTITTVTNNGYNSGDTVENGKEPVEGKWLKIKSITDDDSVFGEVGGTTVKSISNIRGDKLLAPGSPTGAIGHEAGSKVPPATYYAAVSALDETGETLKGTDSIAVTLEPMVSATTEGANSETLDTSTNTRIAQKFTSASTYCNGAFLKMATGGSLVGTLRIETDNSGSPSGTLAHANLEKTGVTLNVNAVKNIFTDAEGVLSDATTYWLVFIVTEGTGTLVGNSSGGSNNVKIYSSSAWNNSSNLKDLYYGVIDDNKIDWNWDDVEGADSYKIFRRVDAGTYDSTSLLGSPTTSDFEDNLEEPGTGEPKASATNSYGHVHEIKERLDVPTNASSGAVTMRVRVSYSFV